MNAERKITIIPESGFYLIDGVGKVTSLHYLMREFITKVELPGTVVHIGLLRCRLHS
jgi:hypothetical protein